MSSSTAVRLCEYAPRFDGNGIWVKLAPTGHAFFTGLKRCSSVWECPPCSHRICCGRAEEIRTVLARHRRSGGGDYLVTCTTPHDFGDGLGGMRRHVANAFRYVISGAPWARIRMRYQVTGYVRAHEVTHGPNGWHPHLHVLLLTARELSAAERQELEAWITGRWQRGILRPERETGRQYRLPLKRIGVVLTRCVDDGAYIAKLGLADELARGPDKLGRHPGHRTGFEILLDIQRAQWADQPADADITLWQEYTAEMRGARHLTWSRGLRQRYAIAEQTDLELAEPDGPEAVPVYEIPGPVWRETVADDVGLQIRILAVVERYPPPEATNRIHRMIERARGQPEAPF